MYMTSRVSLGGVAGCTGAQAYPGPGVYPYAIPSPDMPGPIPPTQDSTQDSVSSYRHSPQGMMLYDGPYFKGLKLLASEQNNLHSGS